MQVQPPGFVPPGLEPPVSLPTELGPPATSPTELGLVSLPTELASPVSLPTELGSTASVPISPASSPTHPGSPVSLPTEPGSQGTALPSVATLCLERPSMLHHDDEEHVVRSEALATATSCSSHSGYVILLQDWQPDGGDPESEPWVEAADPWI